MRVTGNRALVQSESQAGCPRCAAGKGCGGGIFGKLLGNRLRQVEVGGAAGLASGDLVMIAISETLLLWGSLIIYITPLAGLFVGALGARLLFGDASELAIVAGGVTGFLAVFIGLRKYLRFLQADRGYMPVVVRRLAPGEPCLLRDLEEK